MGTTQEDLLERVRRRQLLSRIESRQAAQTSTEPPPEPDPADPTPAPTEEAGVLRRVGRGVAGVARAPGAIGRALFSGDDELEGTEAQPFSANDELSLAERALLDIGGGIQELPGAVGRGLSEVGHRAGIGVSELVGADQAASNLRASRELSRDFYGEPETVTGRVAEGATQLVGEGAMFMAPGAAAGTAARGLQAAGRSGRFLNFLAAPQGAAQRAAQTFLTGAPLDAAIAAAGPEESLAGAIGELTQDPELQEIASDPLARGAFEVVSGFGLGTALGEGVEAIGRSRARGRARRADAAVADEAADLEAQGFDMERAPEAAEPPRAPEPPSRTDEPAPEPPRAQEAADDLSDRLPKEVIDETAIPSFERRGGSRRRAADIIDPEGARQRAELEDNLVEQARATRRAFIDEKTGLANQNAFERARARVDADPELEVVTIDVRNQKAMNDLSGSFELADDFLRTVARELENLGEISTRDIFRSGGDEFAFFAPKGSGDALARRIQEAIGEVPILDSEFTTGIRYGVGDTVKDAELAATAAKAQEKGPKFRDMVGEQEAPSSLEQGSVVSAGVRIGDQVYEGISHADAARHASKTVGDGVEIQPEPGYVTRDGSFVTLDEAERLTGARSSEGLKEQGIMEIDRERLDQIRGEAPGQTPTAVEARTRAELEEEFIGRDDDYWNVEFDEDGASSFRESGYSGTQCTGFACEIQRKIGKARVKVVGFPEGTNPQSAIAQDAGGHDFAVVDDRFIVDPWLQEVSAGRITLRGGAELEVDRVVFDLEDPNDFKTVRNLYGDPRAWVPAAGDSRAIDFPEQFRPDSEAEELSARIRRREQIVREGDEEARVPWTDRAPEPATTGERQNTTFPGRKGKVATEYAVLEAGEVRASHTADFTQRSPSEFPPEIQGRAYHGSRGRAAREETEAQVSGFDPDRAFDRGSTASEGPPTVTTQGINVAGNGRTISMQRLYQVDPERGRRLIRGQLIERAEQFGLDPEAIARMDQPILVRRIVDDSIDQLDTNTLRELNQSSDVPSGKAKDPISDAFSRGEQLRAADGALRHFAETVGEDQTIRAYLETADGGEFLRQLVDDGVISPAERARFLDVTTGSATSEGKELIERMMFAAAIQDADVLARAPSNVLAKMDTALPAIIRADRVPEFEIGETIREALDLMASARAQNMSLDDLAAQIDFTAPRPEPNALRMARFLDDAPKNSRGDRVGVKDAFRAYADEADAFARQTETDDLFGFEPRGGEEARSANFGELAALEPPPARDPDIMLRPEEFEPLFRERKQKLEADLEELEARYEADDIDADEYDFESRELKSEIMGIEGDFDGAARLYFGTTENPETAGYILEDGDFLDFSGGGDGTVRGEDHRSIAIIYPPDYEPPNYQPGTSRAYMQDFINRGNVRVSFHAGGSTAFIDVPPHGVTPAQLRTIARHAEEAEAVFVVHSQAKWAEDGEVELAFPSIEEIEDAISQVLPAPREVEDAFDNLVGGSDPTTRPLTPMQKDTGTSSTTHPLSHDLFGNVVEGSSRQADAFEGRQGLQGIQAALDDARATVSQLEGVAARGAASQSELRRLEEARSLIRRQEGRGLDAGELARAQEGAQATPDDNMDLFGLQANRDGLTYPTAPRNERQLNVGGGRMRTMSPEEFLQLNRQLELDQEAEENILALMEKMRNGEPLDPPLLYDRALPNGQVGDGRHRAIAAQRLGIPEIPVQDLRSPASGGAMRPLSPMEGAGSRLPQSGGFKDDPTMIDAELVPAPQIIRELSDGLSDAMEELGMGLGLKSATGKMPRGGMFARALGVMNTRNQVIRQVNISDVPVFGHEAGHAMHKVFFGATPQGALRNEDLGALPGAIQGELREMAKGISDGSLAEGWAEFWRRYLDASPITVQNRYPNTLSYVEGRLEDFPAIAEAWNVAKRDWTAFRLSSARARVRSQLSIRDRDPFVLDIPNRWARARTAIIDDMEPVRRITQKIKDAVGLESIAEEADTLARLARGSVGVANHFLEHGVLDFKTLRSRGPSLRQHLEPVLDSLDDFREYLVVRRAEELQDRDILTGFRPDDVQASIRQLEELHGDKFKDAFDGVQDWNRGLLTYLRDSGVISKDSFEAIQELNKNYVPFYRVVEGEVGGGAGGQGFGNLFSPVKRIKGSGREVIDPIESLVKNAMTYTQIAQKQQVSQALASMASKEGVGPVLEKLGNPIRRSQFRLGEIEKQLDDVLPGNRELLEELRERADEDFAAATEGLEPDEIDALGIRKWDPAEEILSIFRPGDYLGAPNTISVLENGKRVWYEVDAELYAALTGLDREGLDTWARWMGVPARTLRAGATLAPEFLIRNPVRDQVMAFVQSEYGFIPGIDMARGAFELMNKGEAYQQWIASGGYRSALTSLDRKSMQNSVRQLVENGGVSNVIKHPMDALQAASAVMEDATRMGEFLNTRAQLSEFGEARGLAGRARLALAGRQSAGRGASKQIQQTAAAASREISVDFARHGAKTAGLRHIAAFWNARIQGYDRLFRAAKENPTAFASKAFAMITLPSMYEYLSNRDDPDYWEQPQWKRDLFWMFKIGDDFVSIPKPFELGLIFGTLPVRIMDSALGGPGGNGELHDFLFDSLLKGESSGFMPQPTALMPLIENTVNYSFFLRRPIVPRSEQEVRPRYQAGPYTSEVARQIGQWAPGVNGISPRKIDNLLFAYTGGVGRLATEIADPFLEGRVPFTQKPGDPAPVGQRFPAEFPGIRGVMDPPAGFGSESVQMFYEAYSEARVADSSLRYLERAGNATALDAEASNEEANELRAQLPALRRAAARLAELRADVEAIRRDTTMSSDEKRQKIDELGQVAREEAAAAIGRTLPPG